MNLHVGVCNQILCSNGINSLELTKKDNMNLSFLKGFQGSTQLNLNVLSSYCIQCKAVCIQFQWYSASLFYIELTPFGH